MLGFQINRDDRFKGDRNFTLSFFIESLIFVNFLTNQTEKYIPQDLRLNYLPPTLTS